MHFRVRTLAVPLMMFVAVAGCPMPPTDGESDAGDERDAGLAPGDGGRLDAGSLDAGSLDAGSLDAGSLDAGSLDAGSLDAGVACSAASICADDCCQGESTCLFGVCVTPGDTCVVDDDCASNDYCEPALGEQTTIDAGCAEVVLGRCLPRPIVESCALTPNSGTISAARMWQWGDEPAPVEFADKPDVWSTPTVGRIVDANCDGRVDEADPPNIVFVSSNVLGTFCSSGSTDLACRRGVLRVLDGRSGRELWSLDVDEPSSFGFAGVSVALGDVDQDLDIEILALTGEGKLAVVGPNGVVEQLSTVVVETASDSDFGVGGAISVGDMDNDGWPEIAFGRTVFTMDDGVLAPLFTGTGGHGGPSRFAMSFFVDLDGDGTQELLAGNTAYAADGTALWNSSGAPDGFTAVADFDGDGEPEVVLVEGGSLFILEGATGSIELGPVSPGAGSGGPPLIADLDGDGTPEIGLAMRDEYAVMETNYAEATISNLWSRPSHDVSSSTTGSTAFDFDGDGAAEVVYSDECFTWVYDGATGQVLFSANAQAITLSESPVVADIDGDQRAELLVVHDGADANVVTCAEHTTGADGFPIWSEPASGPRRGVTAYDDVARSWMPTRTLQHQQSYSTTAICDPTDSACLVDAGYGEIPERPAEWWAPNSPFHHFRAAPTSADRFVAADATVNVGGLCASPVTLEISVRNQGSAPLPPDLEVRVFVAPSTEIGSLRTTKMLGPHQTEVIPFAVEPAVGGATDTFFAELVVDPVSPTHRECRTDNNQSASFTPRCD